MSLRQGLRPYEEDGEVAHWRAEFSLTNGKGFLGIADFLAGKDANQNE